MSWGDELPRVPKCSFDKGLSEALYLLSSMSRDSINDTIALYELYSAIAYLRNARKLLSRDVGKYSILPPRNPIRAAMRAVLEAYDAPTHFEKSAHLRYAEAVLRQAYC